jgi:hypothetical protein
MTKYWEIAQLTDGSFVLQSPEHKDDQPLVRIEFSAEAERLLQDQVAEVAQAMIGAGVQAANFLSDRPDETEPTTETSLH